MPARVATRCERLTVEVFWLSILVQPITEDNRSRLGQSWLNLLALQHSGRAMLFKINDRTRSRTHEKCYCLGGVSQT
jgi:hypothetical protein